MFDTIDVGERVYKYIVLKQAHELYWSGWTVLHSVEMFVFYRRAI